MSSKRTTSKKQTQPKKVAKRVASAKKAPKELSDVKQGPRHPRGRVELGHGGKEALAKALASSLARDDEDTDVLAGRLKTASNTQLLRLQRVVEVVKQKWGSREKLIEAIGNATKKSKDKDYLAKLGSFSLPRLVDLAQSGERRARA